MKWKCARCGKEQETTTDRVPKNWKRQDNDEGICGVCWKESYVLRAVSIPVTNPIDMTWDQFGERVRALWRETTRASNWMVAQLYVRDNHSRETGKLQRMPRVYLYPEARPLFPALPSQSCAALEKAVQDKYRARRREVVWQCSANLPTYKYPTPFPIPNQGWTVTMEDNFPVVSLRLGGREEERVRVRLRGGHQFRRQLAQVKQIIAGEAVQAQLDLYRQNKSTMCKMVAWIPRVVRDKAEGTLFVRTDADALLVALNHKDERLWVYNGDQARRWSAEHHHMLQRLSDDQKAEHRPVPPFARRRAEAARKYKDRTASLTHEVSAMLVSYAVRRKFQAIRYDDSDTSFCPKFTWFQLRQKIEQKCDVAGRTFEHVGKPTAVEEEKPLAGE